MILLAIFVVSTFTHAWQIDRQQPVSKLIFLWRMPSALYWIARHADRLGVRVAIGVGGLFVFFGPHSQGSAMVSANGGRMVLALVPGAAPTLPTLSDRQPLVPGTTAACASGPGIAGDYRIARTKKMLLVFGQTDTLKLRHAASCPFQRDAPIARRRASKCRSIPTGRRCPAFATACRGCRFPSGNCRAGRTSASRRSECPGCGRILAGGRRCDVRLPRLSESDVGTTLADARRLLALWC